MSQNPPPRLRLRLTATAETIVRGGHPWVFADSVRETNRAGQLGELAIMYDRKDQFLAAGLYDPDSPIRVRIVHAGKPRNIDAAFWRERLATTLARRDGLFDANTTGYRCINGESDGWPGLVVDRYADTFVVKIYTGAWLPRLAEIFPLLQEKLSPQRIVLRLSRNIQAMAKQKFHREDGQVVLGTVSENAVVFHENGIAFEAEVLRGQKTGFFLDQRENRREVEKLATGREVLNAFSFSGGFSLYAARGSAKSVTDLDISAHALASAQRNFALNQADRSIAQCRYESVQADVFEWLQNAIADKRRFDLIILDPPSLAKRETERAGAIIAYERLASQGIALLRPGGILLAASCSAHVSSEEFWSAVRRAATRSGRKYQEFLTAEHAPDHHAAFFEAKYLKSIYLRF